MSLHALCSSTIAIDSSQQEGPGSCTRPALHFHQTVTVLFRHPSVTVSREPHLSLYFGSSSLRPCPFSTDTRITIATTPQTLPSKHSSTTTFSSSSTTSKSTVIASSSQRFYLDESDLATFNVTTTVLPPSTSLLPEVVVWRSKGQKDLRGGVLRTVLENRSNSSTITAMVRPMGPSTRLKTTQSPSLPPPYYHC